jgi:hypothetical protein
MKVRVLFILLLITFFCKTKSFAQNVSYTLIVVHYDPASKGEFKQLVYGYRFLNGHFQGRDELITFKGRVKEGKTEKDYIRTDLGTNILYKNRYLITGIGNIIDLKEKKVLFDQKANLVRCSNDSAIYYTNDAFKGKFYSVYNFTTNKYAEVKSLTFKAVAGQDIEFDRSAQPYKLNFYPVDKPKIVLSTDAGYGQTNTESKRNDISVWWLDKNSFVYPNFNKDNTEITFVKVSIDTKASVPVGKASIKQQNEQPSFTKISKTQAQYNFGEKKFIVDVEKNTVTELQFTNPENGFSVECKTQPYGHIIKYNGKEVAKQHFQIKNLRTEQNIAVIVKELVVGTESYQQGLSVWNHSKQAWQSVDAEEVVALIGWIKE